MNNFENELSALINKYNKEKETNTPDFVLAAYLVGCLDAYSKAQLWLSDSKYVRTNSGPMHTIEVNRLEQDIEEKKQS